MPGLVVLVPCACPMAHHTRSLCFQVMLVAKDQNGCRFLQRKFDEGGATAIGAVLPEVLDNLVDLMMDPFGNYLIQKLLDRCSEDQRMQVRPRLLQASPVWACRERLRLLKLVLSFGSAWKGHLVLSCCMAHLVTSQTLQPGKVESRPCAVLCCADLVSLCNLQVLRHAAENKQLVSVALNTHGTRAVQKLIETLTSAEQVGAQLVLMLAFHMRQIVGRCHHLE